MKRIKINIANPCGQSWENMKQKDGSHYCGSCERMILDFTKFKDSEIVSFLNQSKSKPCAAFRPDQLDRVLRLNPVQPFNQRVAGFFVGIAAALGLGGGYANSTKNSQPENSSISSVAGIPPRMNQLMNIFSIHLTGTIIDDITHLPLAHVQVIVDGTDQCVFSNELGQYKIEILNVEAGRQISLTANYKDYVSSTKILNPEDHPMVLNFEMVEANHEYLFSGIVLDGIKHKPINNATIEIGNFGKKVNTNSKGEFNISVLASELAKDKYLNVSKNGYDPHSIYMIPQSGVGTMEINLFVKGTKQVVLGYF